MARALLSDRAKRDIAEIWDYSVERWSESQAERYLRTIEAALNLLAEDPERARPCDDIRPGYRRIGVGSHVVFFRVVQGDVHVSRILHERMDFRRHLRS